ncbi:hypothetical protein EZS27_033096 [termite gut metagenome]|uniref:Uncharacterized protein n=1 Tax=termite gut metagenome TaxID=433724 RepID=A0A5J4Q4Q7_9ZZZZ
MKEKDDIGGRKSKNEQIEGYLQERYDFRFNTVKSKPEFRQKNGNHPFSPVTKFDLNSLKREMDRTMGISTSSDNIRTILESDFSPKIHPVRDYFNRLPRLDPDINNYTWQVSWHRSTAMIS